MKRINFKLFSIYLLTSLIFFSCKKDDDPTPDPTGMTGLPVASFQATNSETNYREVTFENFSKDATSVSWDFGDGNTSTEDKVTHTYPAESNTYTVVLTARNEAGEDTQEKEVIIKNPNEAIIDLTGDTEKVWKLSRVLDAEPAEFPYLVGPETRSEIWWSFGGIVQLPVRRCVMEATYTFTADGRFIHNNNGMIYAEEGIWPTEKVGMCLDETQTDNVTSVTGENLRPWGSGEHTFAYDPSASTLTLNGLGAHIGIAKVATNSEVTSPQENITYKVTKLETEGPVEKLQLETSFQTGDGTAAYWQINLVSYKNPNDEPVIGEALPEAGFIANADGNTITFTNTSANASSYMWDFGDGNTSTDESPVHTYSGAGNYTVTLTALNEEGAAVMFTNPVIVAINSVFSASTLFGEDSKSWKLAPQANALAVGPAIGSGEWWANTADDVTVRTCAFNDTYTFTKDGAFEYNANSDVWGEMYMGVDPDGCISEEELSDGAKAWGSGTHSFTVTEAMGDTPAYLTVTGTGAFIALPKAYNGGEYAMGPPVEGGSVTYQVHTYANAGASEILQLTVDISEGETASSYWTFTLVSE